MKLSRALVAAAATAVVAPLALLSATVAAADPAGPASAESAESAVSASASDPSGSSTDGTGTPTGTGVPTGAATETGAETAAETPGDTESPTDAGSGTPTGTSTGTPTGTPTSSTSPSATGEPEPTAEPSETDYPFCEEVDSGHTTKVSAAIEGLPGRIVAGDGPHSFRLTVRNDSGTALENVHLYAEVENYELEESEFLSPHVQLEFKDGDAWTRIGDGDWAGDDFLGTTLEAHAAKSVQLRLTVGAEARPGDAYSFGSGAYLDRVGDRDCIAEGWAQYDFEVLKPGSANPDPGTATPSDSDKKPQGGTGSSAGAGNLARTGSSSALPVIGLVGGVAVVAGAGAVFAVRRRKGGAGS